MKDSEEDTAEYWLYPTDLVAEEAALDTLAEVYSKVEEFTRNYVWTRDKFNLKVEHLPYSPDRDGIPCWCLSGKTYYGENVMDEWFIVSLLMEITKTFTSLVARIIDTDGEILLIQAADSLPAWAGEPDLASGRVYLHQGRVHLLPVCSDPASVTPIPGVTPPPPVCARVIASYPSLSLASDQVQAAIRDKLSGMPGPKSRGVSDNHHVTNVMIPRAVATLLSRDVSFLSRIVTAVNERDPIDMRKARSMTRVRPEVMTRSSVRFSRCLYAMVTSTKVTPARASGWDIGQDKEKSLGFKLCLGLEILLARKKRHSETPVESLKENKEWVKFLERLRANNYFRGEMEGSQVYKKLEQDAMKFFSESLEENTKEMNIDEAFHECLNNPPDSTSDSAKSAVIGPPVDKEDSEQWLEMTPEILDSMLEAQFGISKEKSEAQNIPDEVNKFLNKVSDMAGVEHEQDGIKFDPENLVDSMKKLMSEMDKESGSKLFDSDEDEDSDEDDLGTEDHVMQDYMAKLGEEIPKDTDDLDKPLDIDSNVLSNLLQSYSEELGHGPVSSLFQSMRVNPGRKDTVQQS